MLDRRLKGRQVDLPLGALGHHGVVSGGVAPGLLVVDGVVLDLGQRALRLDALDIRGADLPGQVGVLAERLEGPAPAGVTDDVDGRGEHHVGALAPLLGAEGLAVLFHQPGVPRRGAGDRGGQLGDAGGAVTHSDRAVLQPQGRDAKPGVRRHAAGVPARRSAVQHGQLLGLRHRGHDQVGALGGRQRSVHPGLVRGLGGGADLDGGRQNTSSHNRDHFS